MKIEVEQVDYHDSRQAGVLLQLLDAYARDPMGGAHPLSDHAKQHLVQELAQRPTAFSVLAFVDGAPAGLVNCFEGFSTFACQPLVNIHDVIVLPEFRGGQVGRLMLERVEQIALQRGCCKLTLEVLQENVAAQKLYRKFGFADYQLAAAGGNAMFLQKPFDR